jgi:hypothetical protein
MRFAAKQDCYQIRSHNPLLMSSGRDVPAERLYKVMWVDQKGAIKPGFGMNSPYPAMLTLQSQALIGKKTLETRSYCSVSPCSFNKAASFCRIINPGLSEAMCSSLLNTKGTS